MAQKQDITKLLYKIAKAYYEDNLTQQQIADRFGLSRIKVSRLLTRARSDKVVQITIHPPQASNADLERAIEKTFAIKEAVVVACSDDDEATVVGEIGVVAANTLLQCLQGNETLGLSWGKSLLAVVNAMPAANLPNIRVVQILGGLGELEAPVHGVELCRRMAQALGAHPRFLHTPGIVQRKVVRDALVSDPQIQDTLQLATQAQVAVLGIGVFKEDSTLLRSNILTEEEIADLRAKGAVGDMALQFFNAKGHRVKSKVDSRIVSTSLDEIKKIPRVIGVAGGADKFEVIRAVLLGGLVDVIVTDQFTAQRLIEEGSL